MLDAIEMLGGPHDQLVSAHSGGSLATMVKAVFCQQFELWPSFEDVAEPVEIEGVDAIATRNWGCAKVSTQPFSPNEIARF